MSSVNFPNTTRDVESGESQALVAGSQNPSCCKKTMKMTAYLIAVTEIAVGTLFGSRGIYQFVHAESEVPHGDVLMATYLGKVIVGVMLAVSAIFLILTANKLLRKSDDAAQAQRTYGT